MDKPRLFFERDTSHRHRYDFVTFTIREGIATPLADLIEQCTDNKIGYYDAPHRSGAETARMMLARYQWLLDSGYSDVFTRRYSSGYANLAIEFQHYEAGQYCDAKISPADNLQDLQASIAVLNRILSAGKRRKRGPRELMRDPELMLSILTGSLKATRIARVDIPTSISQSTWTDQELCVPTAAVGLGLAMGVAS